MKFSVGDDVVILSNGKVAEVLQILHPKILEVCCEGDVFPVFIKDIQFLSEVEVKRGESKAKVAQKELVKKEEKQWMKPSIEDGFYLTFQPIYALDDKERIQELKLSFVNQTSFPVMLRYECLLSGQVLASEKAVISPKIKTLFLHNIAFDAMNELPQFCYTVKPLEDAVDWENGVGFYFANQLKIRPKKLFVYLAEMQSLKQNHFNVALGTPKLAKSEIAKKTNVSHETFENKSMRNSVVVKKNIPKRRSKNEIDLHTESLGINTKNVDNFEILSQQLHALQMAIDEAALSGQTSLIIIHGLGNGRLKEEVHLLLKTHPSVTFFQHSWRPKYGNGATEAFLR